MVGEYTIPDYSNKFKGVSNELDYRLGFLREDIDMLIENVQINRKAIKEDRTKNFERGEKIEILEEQLKFLEKKIELMEELIKKLLNKDKNYNLNLER